MHLRRKWQPTPVFLPGESQGRGSLVGCHLWGHTAAAAGAWLIYNVVLISGVPQSTSIVHIQGATLFKILFPYWPLKRTQWSSLCYKVGSY